MPDTLIVAAAVVDSLAAATRVVSARRTEPPRWAGWWEFPGGKVEPGESPVAALHRELAEEIGVTVRLGAELPGPALIDGARPWPIDEGLLMRVWFVEVVTGVPRVIDDHDELRWLSVDELDSVPWLPGNVGVLQAARAFMRP